MRRWRTALVLAWKDFAHEWRISACLVLGLAAVLTPLLVLFGLKSGIVATLTERLLADPTNLEVVVLGNGRLDRDWFAARARDPLVRFVVPRTRSLAATIDLVAGASGGGGGRRVLAGVEMLPTAAGDPVLAGRPVPSEVRQVVLSAAAARRLGVAPGDPLAAAVPRQTGERREAGQLGLTVLDVLPDAAMAREAVFVPLALLTAAEDFRDGFAVPDLGWPGERSAPPRTVFASARLYATGIDAVAPLAAALAAAGMEVRTRAAEIEQVRAIDRVLSFLFTVIAGIGAGGFVLSLAASLWANVDRKQKDLALLRLVGFTTAPLVAFPAAQAVMIALCGAAASAACYAAVAASLNAVLSENLAHGEVVCRLPLPAALAALLLTLVLSVLASALGGFRASRIEPSQCLREV
ncbi:FtsX-like permease family protein [Azospirillum sp. TSO22-1]|uniref:FtsX-like permease family protein n=1 Tax=Azospirillum sp. TSO22-1 TaxID=716789 RepID=UPI000D61E3B1|nr:FtsX-like permease family protein [Azospirillum sp. TSO22-1]PWC40176.1 hypothetical protein TSO221_25725 [Azospirillum sp. TSO22-1]